MFLWTLYDTISVWTWRNLFFICCGYIQYFPLSSHEMAYGVLIVAKLGHNTASKKTVVSLMTGNKSIQINFSYIAQNHSHIASLGFTICVQ